ncbi:MAG: alpha/beta hydrolase [Jatrophihabitantaceae bacterium]
MLRARPVRGAVQRTVGTAHHHPHGTADTPEPSEGTVITRVIPGTTSGFVARPAMIYLPPQYFQPRFARTRFPVVELLHGTPGSPSNWVVHLNVVHLADQLVSKHLMGPMVLVMPTMSPRRDCQECVDAPGALDDTCITDDVRADLLARYRVSSDPAEWGIAGYSSGGYCSANLALRHPADFGAAGVMDGYFRPQDGPAAAALHFNQAAEAARDPLLLASALHRDASPLPAFWVSVGTGDAADLNGALAFGAALHGVEEVPLYREPGAVHNFYAWQPAAPRLLAWMWPLLAPPQLRVDFPIAGRIENGTITGGTGHSRAPRTSQVVAERHVKRRRGRA